MSKETPAGELEQIGYAGGRRVYYDDCRGTYHTWYDEAEYEPVSTALLLTVSSVLGIEPTDLGPLNECIDPDALNAIFVHWRGDEPRVGDGSLSFTFSNCAVTVHNDGEIVIEPFHAQSSPA